MSLDLQESWDFAIQCCLAAPERIEQKKDESFSAYQLRVKDFITQWLSQAKVHERPSISADNHSRLSAMDLICSIGGSRKWRIMFRQLPAEPALLTLRVPFAEERWQAAVDIPLSGTDDDKNTARWGYTQPVLNILFDTLRLSPEENAKWLGSMMFYCFRGEPSVFTRVVSNWSRSRPKFDWPEYRRLIAASLSPDYFQPHAPMPCAAEEGLPDTHLGALALTLAASMSSSHVQVYVAEGLVEWLELHPEILALPIPMENRRLAAGCRVHDRTFPVENAILADLLWPVLAEVRNTTVFNDENEITRASLRDQRFLESVYLNGGAILGSLEDLFTRNSRTVAQIERWLARQESEFSLCERHREHQARQAMRVTSAASDPAAEPCL
jgi:hypothetical protein